MSCPTKAPSAVQTAKTSLFGNTTAKGYHEPSSGKASQPAQVKPTQIDRMQLNHVPI
ncbi:hypothetical protein MPLA_870034 [Mesorhizobium sp. ORS 3359]|nr:hypothetical protein MPLA_870034 [Mesorhizobium sp. ORS 3359]